MATRDVFISHASEDKAVVARPLADALSDRGWTVWLDELELTIGDSLSGKINEALAQSRFGVVVLSPRFFEKAWTTNELAGLAAREVDARTKVILPVWHEVDHTYLVERAPILADRLGASTVAGIDDVADKLDRALQAAARPPVAGLARQPVVQGLDTAEKEPKATLPTTNDALELLGRDKPRFWEYLVFAGALAQGRATLEDKRRDHQLRLSRGERHLYRGDEILEWLSAEMDWLRRQLLAIDRVFAPDAQERALGPDDKPGDVDEIRYFAGRVLGFYELMMDWAAQIRNAVAPSEYGEVIEAHASAVDEMVVQAREFINQVITDFARIPELAEHATRDNPLVITATLDLDLGEVAVSRAAQAMERLVQRLT